MLSRALFLPEMNFILFTLPCFIVNDIVFFIYRYIFYPVKYAVRYFTSNSE